MSRLDEIKEIHNRALGLGLDEDARTDDEIIQVLKELFAKGHTDYLIQQAEHVEELEGNYVQELDESQRTYDYFKSEINRYKQALEEIAFNFKDVFGSEKEWCFDDVINIATKALKEGEADAGN